MFTFTLWKTKITPKKSALLIPDKPSVTPIEQIHTVYKPINLSSAAQLRSFYLPEKATLLINYYMIIKYPCMSQSKSL